MTLIQADTKLIHIASQTYPVLYKDLSTRHPGTAFPPTASESLMSAFGYAYVNPTTQPEGNYVEGVPHYLDGKYYQTWTPANKEDMEKTLAKAKAKLLDVVEQNRQRLMQKGFKWRFGQTIEHVQLRDGDRANLAGLRIDADLRIRNQDTTPYYFRTYENQTHAMTPVALVEMTKEALVQYQTLLGRTWLNQGTIQSAETLEALPKEENLVFEL